jgi:tetratricopeptide (TPR) repeat protein
VEALALVGIRDVESALEHASSDSSEDLQMKAKVLATQRGSRAADAAIELLELLAGRQPLSAPDQYLLAQLYERTGDWFKARERFEGLHAAHSTNADYLAALALGSLRHKDLSRAEDWLARLEKTDPSSFRTREIKARLLHSRGKSEEAAAILKRFAESKDADILQAAAVMESLGLGDTEELYRKAGESDQPGRKTSLAFFLARKGRVGEALNACAQMRADSPPDEWVTTAVAILFMGRADKDQLLRVEGWLLEELRKRSNDVGLLSGLANVCMLQCRARDAERLYRQILEQSSHDVSAMNNLAWLLALEGRLGTEGLQWINKAIQLAGPQPNLLDTRGIVNLALGNNDEAVADLTRAADLGPNGTIYFHLARAQAAANDPDAARRSLRKARNAGLKESSLLSLEQSTYQGLLKEIGSD